MRSTLKILLPLLLAMPALLSAATVHERQMQLYQRDLGPVNQHSYVITQDSKGHYWYGTANGLFRHDGSQLLQLFSNPGEALHHKSIIRLYSRGAFLWIGTHEGLFRRNIDSYHLVDLSSPGPNHCGLADLHIRHFQETPTGQFWLATTRAVGRYDEVTQQFDSIELPDEFAGTPQQLITSFAVNSEPYIWIVKRSYGLVIYDRKNKQFLHAEEFFSALLPDQKVSIDSRSVSYVQAIDDNTVGFANQYFYYEFSQGELVTQVALPEFKGTNLSNKLTVAANGDVWLIHGKSALVRISQDRTTVTHYHNNENRPDGLKNLTLNHLFFDRSGHLAISYLNEGPQFWNPINERILPIAIDTDKYPIHRFKIHYFLQGKDGAFWLMSDSGDFLFFDRHLQLMKYIEANVHSESAVEDRYGNLWFNSIKGLFRIDKRNFAIEQIYDKSISSLAYDEDHGLWASSYDGLVIKFDYSGGQLQRYKPGQDLGFWDWYVYIDPVAGPWTLSDGKLYYLDGEKGGFLSRSDTGKPNDLKIYSKVYRGELWHAESDLYSMHLSLAGEQAERVVERRAAGVKTLGITHSADINGRVWFSNNDGFVYAYHKASGVLRKSDISLGFPRSRDTIVLGEDAGGRVIAFESGGLVAIDRPSEQLLPADAVPTINSVNTLKVTGEKTRLVALGEGVDVYPDDVAVEVHFSRNDYSDSASEAVEYRVIGVHNNWLRISDSKLSLLGLTPGRYTLQIRDAGAPGQITALNIKVIPPWWRSPVALILYSLLAAVIVFTISYLSWSRNRIKRKADEQIQLYAKGFEAVGEGFCIVNNKAEIVSFNTAFANLTGLEAAEPRVKISHFYSDRLPTEDYTNQWRNLRREGSFQGHSWIKHVGGGDVPVEYKASVVRSGEDTLYMMVVKDVTERLAYEEELKRLAAYDSLTNVPNRKTFEDAMDVAIGSFKARKADGFYLLFVDLNRFKEINDNLGHKVGDGFLVEVAKRLKCSVRKDDLVARFGGDEFVVILQNLNNPADARLCCEKIISSFDSAIYVDGQKLFASLSIGVAAFPEDGDNVDTLLKKADDAMYDVKGGEGSRYIFYSEMS